MDKIAKAIAEGRCALAVSASLLHDPKVILALTDRAALRPMALSGPAQSPIVAIGETGIARAIAAKHGVLVLVEPERADLPGVEALAGLIARGPHKPQVFVVSRKLDFQVTMALRGLTVEQVKDKGQAFIQALPQPPAEEAVPAPVVDKAKASSASEAPGAFLVGREDEVASLAAVFGVGGPVVVSGAPGVGRRALIEHAAAAAGLRRLPDLRLARDAGYDALAGRLAVMLDSVGQSGLKDAIAAHATPPAQVEAALAGLAEAEALADAMMVIEDLEVASGTDGAFFRKSRLELLVEALLVGTYPLRLVFTSTVQPVFYREGRDAGLRRVEVDGIKGRFYHEVFGAFGASDVPRDRFGPLHERLHGHPLAVRLAAVAVREHPELAQDDKAFRLEGPADAKGLGKLVERRLKGLSADLRTALITAAHLRLPASGRMLADLGINRRTRDALVLRGLLDPVGVEGQPRRFAVHPIVVEAIGSRETSDFAILHQVGRAWLAAAEAEADALTAFAWRQEANRCLDRARQGKEVVALGVPDDDAVVDNATGMLRARVPKPDLAVRLIDGMLRTNPSNADAWLLRLEWMRGVDAPKADRAAAVEAAIAAAPVPELFHEAVGFHRGASGDLLAAIAVMEQGVSLLPDHSRLRCRLASLLLRQGRRPDAIAQLDQAMALDPKLPDAYGLLGALRAEEGALSLDAAETLLREAVALAPDDIVQTARLVRLLLDIAAGMPARAEAVRTEIRERLDHLREVHKEEWEVYALYAEALREEGADADKIGWFLQRARKLAPKRRGIDRRFRLEGARLDLIRGALDRAERTLKEMASRDPSDGEVLATLAEVHAGRGYAVAAHAELSRAIDRMSPHALSRARAEARLAEFQAAIVAESEAMAAGLAAPPIPGTAAARGVAPIAGIEADDDSSESTEPPAAPPSGGEPVVRRRRGGRAAAEAVETAPEPPGGADETPSPVEGPSAESEPSPSETPDPAPG